MSKNAIFCRECGSRLEKHDLNQFDELTGERVSGYHCPNLKCQVGCEFEGHVFKLFRACCQRCGGYRHSDCYY